MSDAYSSFPSLLEEKAVTVVSADAWLATASGTRLACKTFEQGLRADPRDYNKIDLPAIAFTAEMPADDDPSTLENESVTAVLTATIVVEHGDLATRRTLALDIGARLRRIFREQVEGGAWSDLAASVPGASNGTIDTRVSGPVVDDLGQSEDRSTSRLAVGVVAATVTVDVDATL